MKALTLHQPWASLIGFGLKEFETRPRNSKHRGPIAIHAGKTVNEQALLEVSVDWNNYITRPMSRRWSSIGAQDFHLGAIVAVAEMTDSIKMDEEFIASQTPLERSVGDWEVGRYAYKLENIQALITPIQASGKQGLWNVPDDLLESLNNESNLRSLTG